MIKNCYEYLYIILIFFIVIVGLFFLNSCTYSITMVHTEGTATDVVDETASATPSTSISVPISATSFPLLPSFANGETTAVN